VSPRSRPPECVESLPMINVTARFARKAVLRVRSIRSLAAARARDDRGQMLVLGALAMTALCGMTALAVDVGLLLHERQGLQNATDAATLAAVAFLPTNEGAAVDAAVAYSELNGYPLSPADVLISSTNSQNDTVEIVNDTSVDLFFARVLGFVQATPATSASAQVGAMAAGNGVVPFGIEPLDFEAGESPPTSTKTESATDRTRRFRSVT